MSATIAHLSIGDVEQLHESAGGYFFSSGAKRFFRSRIGTDTFTGPGGVYFVTSEQFVGSDGYKAPRRYTVRRFDPAEPSSIGMVGKFQAYATGAIARSVAKRAASGRCFHDGCNVPRSRFDADGLPTCGNHESDKP